MPRKKKKISSLTLDNKTFCEFYKIGNIYLVKGCSPNGTTQWVDFRKFKNMIIDEIPNEELILFNKLQFRVFLPESYEKDVSYITYVVYNDEFSVVFFVNGFQHESLLLPDTLIGYTEGLKTVKNTISYNGVIYKENYTSYNINYLKEYLDNDNI